MSSFRLEDLIVNPSFIELGKTNLLLIEDSVMEPQMFVESANNSTFPIIYSPTSAKSDLVAVLRKNFTSINRIAVCFTFMSNTQLFLDYQPFFNNNESSESPYSENIAFLISVINEFKVTNIDFLACNTLNYPEWVNYYNILSKETNVVVGASNNRTGNINYGGDWIMENTCQDIEFIYFNTNIGYYKYLLDLTSSTILISDADGSIWGCGYNGYGQLGIGSTTSQNSLTLMSSMPSNKTPLAVYCGSSHTIVLMTDGSIWGCGYNGYGQLGIGSTTSQNSLTLMNTTSSGRTPLAVYCGLYHTMVLMTDGSIWGCGYNRYGQLGIGSTINKSLLTLMNTTSSGRTPLAVAGGSTHTIVLMTDGSIWGCGQNYIGQLGIGSTTQQTSLTQMNTTSSGRTPLAVACGSSHTIVLMTDFSVWGCGYNYNGQLGIGSTTSQNSLTQITYSDPVTGAIVSNFCRLSNSRPKLATLLGTYSLTSVRPAGYTKSEFTFAGYTAPQLKTALFTVFELKIAGYTINELLYAGFTLANLASVGFSKEEFTAANSLYTASYLKTAGFTAAELKTAGFSATELKAVLFTLTELKAALFTAAQLKVALFTLTELKAAGFTLAELITIGFTLAELKTDGFTIAELKTAGFTAAELKTIGFTLSDFRFTPLRIWFRDTYGDSWNNGSISFTESSTNLNLITLTGPADGSRNWFYTDIPFKNNIVYNVTKINGYYPYEILFAITNTAISTYLNTTTPITTSTSSTVLAEISNINTFSVPSSYYYYSAAELITAGFTLTELKTAGFTAAQLKVAGFTATELKTALFTAAQLKDAGFTATELKTAGYTFEELRDAMYSLSELSIYFPSISNVYISSHNYKYIYITGSNFVTSDIVTFVGPLVPSASLYSVEFINSTSLKVTMDSEYEIESVTVKDIYNNTSNIYQINPDLMSNICFIAGTPITTDQCNIPIEKIDTSIHTIRNKKIVAITKTVTQDKYLVCFEKDSLGKNIPSQKTIISKNHQLFYNGKMRMAKEFLKNFDNVENVVVKVKYTGSALYNVLLEEHDNMMVNNLICETLDPENGVAKVYMALQKLDTEEEKQSLIQKINSHVIKNNIFNNNNNSNNKKTIK